MAIVEYRNSEMYNISQKTYKFVKKCAGHYFFFLCDFCLKHTFHSDKYLASLQMRYRNTCKVATKIVQSQ
jgi:hypothetical protein